MQNWRGVVAPPGISPEQEKALEDLLVDKTRTPRRGRTHWRSRDWARRDPEPGREFEHLRGRPSSSARRRCIRETRAGVTR